MKRLLFLTLTFFFSGNLCFGQSCLPEGLRILGPSDIIDFIEEYPECTCILGDVEIKGTFDQFRSLAGIEQIRKIEGNLILNHITHRDEELEHLDSIIYIGGDLTISTIQSKDLMQVFNSLEHIGGDFLIEAVYYNDTNTNHATDFGNSFPKLKGIGGDMKIKGFMENLTGFTKLKYVGGSFIANHSAGSSVKKFTSIDTIGEDIDISVWNTLDKLKMDHLKYVGGQIRLWKCFGLLEASFDSLSHVGEDISFTECNALSSPIHMPMLKRINGDLTLIELENAEQIGSFANLEVIENDLEIKDCEKTLNLEGFPKLKVVGRNFELNSNKELGSLHGLTAIDSIKGHLYLRASPVNSLVPISNTIDHIGSIRTTGALRNFRGLERLKKLGGISFINYLLEDFSGLDSLEYLGSISLDNIPHVKNFKGLEHIDSLISISIKDNDMIESLEGIESALGLRSVRLTGNEKLNICASEWLCDELDNVEYLTIYENGADCESKQKIKDVCKRRYKIFVESFYDLNENGIKDENEKLISGPLYNISPQDNYAYFSDPELPFLYVGVGEYEVIIDEETLDIWDLTSDIESYVVSVDSMNTSGKISFGFVPKEFMSSSELHLIANSLRCNTFATLTGNFINNGNTVLSGTNYITTNEIVDSITFEIEPDTIISDTIFGWHFQDLFPGYVSNYKMRFKVPGPLDFEIGDKLKFSGSADYTDQNSNNYNVGNIYEEEIRCSYDPNDKKSSPLYLDQYSLFGEKLTYTIRFQNTGNDEAYDIIIQDTLSENLDLTTFKVIASSHASLLSTQLNRNNRSVAFGFNNIYLPDSTTNEPESHGFISYTIYPKSDLEEETMVENKAFIYFDFNPPIITNTTDNIMVSELPTLGAFEVEEQHIIMYPNPANKLLNYISSQIIDNIELFDFGGNLIRNINPNSTRGTIDLEGLINGLYIVKIYTNTGLTTRKIIVN